jgi:type 1 fimbria pilin
VTGMKNMIMKVAFCCLLFSFSGSTYALYCTNGSQTITHESSGGVIVTPLSLPMLSKNLLTFTLADMGSFATCKGMPDTSHKDALQATGLYISNSLIALGYSGYIISGGQEYSSPPDWVCLWPGNTCSSSYPGAISTPLNVQIKLKRNAGSGSWSSGATIPAGTEIASLKTRFRYYGGTWGPYFWWSFTLQNDLVIPAYTCNITQYDKNVTLPDVNRSALQNHGNGRYPDVKKEFQFALACDVSTGVSVTFEGDALSGTDNVLKNASAGNDNVGVQMLFNDNTPVKLATRYPVISSAQTSEILKLSAWYYYKGGSIAAGPVKANTTFTFDYH